MKIKTHSNARVAIAAKTIHIKNFLFIYHLYAHSITI